jgi:hypothetical protein
MPTKRYLLALPIVAALIGLAEPALSAATAKPEPAISPNADSKSIDELAIQFSVDTGNSIEDAKAALSTNGPLIDLVSKYRKDPSFGALWVTYKPFTVHLRTTRKSKVIEGDVAASVRRSVQVTTGGLSQEALDSTAALVNDQMKKQKSPYEIITDTEKGRIIIRSNNANFGRISSDVDVELREPPVAPATTGYGGLAFWLNSTNGWVQQCTGGFMVRRTIAPFDTGILTAGHCYDYASQYYNGETASAPELEMCAGGDQQVHPLTGTPNNWSALGGLGNPAWININGSGGGFYIGQVVQKRGRVSGGSFGTIQEYVYNPAIGGATDCGPNGYNINVGLRVSNPSQAGDSGGPLTTYYNGLWLAMGIASGGNETGTTINPIWNVYFFQQWALCSTISC